MAEPQTTFFRQGVDFTRQTLTKNNLMGNLLYVVAVILLIGWLIGVVGYSVGRLIHILLVLTVIAILLRIIEGRKPLT